MKEKENFVCEQKKTILDKGSQFLSKCLIENEKICVLYPNRRQFPKDVGFTTSFSFNIGVRKLSKPIKCDSGKHFSLYTFVFRPRDSGIGWIL